MTTILLSYNIKYQDDQTKDCWQAPSHCFLGEPLFVPEPGSVRVCALERESPYACMHVVPFMCLDALFPKKIFYMFSFKLRRTDALRSLPLPFLSLTFLHTYGHHTTAGRGCRMGDMHTISDEIHAKSHVHLLILFALASTTFVNT
jgi:hypothetical protein